MKATALEFNQRWSTRWTDQPVQRAPLPGLAPDPVRGLGDRRDRVADPRHRRTASARPRGPAAAADHVHGAYRDRARRTAAVAVHPAAAWHILLLSAEGRSYQSLGPSHPVCPTSMPPNRSRRPRPARPRRIGSDRRRPPRCCLPAADAAGRCHRQRPGRHRPGSGIGASISSTDPMLDMGKNLKRGDNVVALTYKGGPRGTLPAPDRARLLRRRHLADRAASGGPQDPWRTEPAARVQRRPEQGPAVQAGDRRQPEPAPVRPGPLPGAVDLAQAGPAARRRTLDVVSSNGQVVGGKNYDVTAYDLQPTPQQLHDAIGAGEPDRYTSRVPCGLAVHQGTDPDHHESANGNQFDAAVLLQNCSAAAAASPTAPRPSAAAGCRPCASSCW